MSHKRAPPLFYRVTITASSVPEKRRAEYYTTLPAVVLGLGNVPGALNKFTLTFTAASI